MKRIFIIILTLLVLCSCSKKTAVQNPSKPSLSVEQLSSYNGQITKLISKKSWVLEQNITYSNITLPQTVENTYYAQILNKSKDVGLDFSKELGKEAIEVLGNVKYSNRDVSGVGHFIFLNNKLIGAYYMVGNYIYSLNEKEVFKKDVKWENNENISKKMTYKEIEFPNYQNLMYWTKENNESYLFTYDQNRLKRVKIEKNQLITQKEVSLDGLFITSMFVKDIDRDKKMELALLLSQSQVVGDEKAKNKLVIYEFSDKLKQKYDLDFNQPMLSIDYDGKDIIATSKDSIQMYSLEDGELKKNFTYNKVGGLIKVDDIDNSGILRYFLIDSSGTDIYVFERTKNDLEEVWRSYNNKSQFSLNIQLADLNGDNVKEIYLKDKENGSRKIVLDKNGFIEKKDIKSGHYYFVLDNNCDGKYEYFDISKNSKTKKLSILYKY